mgnify:CR=1 FL=1
MSKKIIAAVIVGLIAVSSAGYAVFSRERFVEQELAQYGQIERNRIERQKGNRIEIMKGKKIVIYKDDYDALISELLINGVDEKQAEVDAEKSLLREEALYIIARDSGVEVSDEEVLKVIEINKEQALKASNYNDFETFLKAADLTVEEYWDNQFDRLKKKQTVAKYKEEYLKNNNKLKKLVGTPEYTQAVEREFNKIADKFIKKDKVVKLN